MQRILLPIILTLLAASGWVIAYWLLQNPDAPDDEQASPELSVTQPLPSLAPVLQQVMPGVVNISARGVENVRDPIFEDPFFRYLFAPNGRVDSNQPEVPPTSRSNVTQETFSSLGSGVIVDAKQGYVLTNYHVIDGATEITVNLIDDRELPAKVIGSDKESDIALLKIPADNLTAIPIAQEDGLVLVGDFMVAIGNPFGLKHSVTFGIISGLGRSGIAGGYEDLIQTDVPINLGNSGGALIDMQGRLVGVNKAILSQSGGSVGIGFAIPIAQAVDVMEQLVKYGEVRRGRLGIRGQTLTEELANLFGTAITSGVIVTDIRVGSAGQRAGIRPGDIIIGLNGKRVVDSQSLENAIGLSSISDNVSIVIVRQDEELTLAARLQAFVPEEIFGGDLRNSLNGAMFGNAEDYRYPVNFGVIVTAVEPNTPAWDLGLEQGDIVTSVQNQRVGKLEDFELIMLNYNGDTSARILRGQTPYNVLVPDDDGVLPN